MRLPRPDPLGRYCETHKRWECVKSRSRGRGECHGPAIKDTDVCRHHAGRCPAQARQAVIDAWAQIPGDDQVTPQEVVAAQMGLSFRRSQLLGDQLRSACELSDEAITGPLAEHERAERRLCVQIAQIAQAMGLQERRADVQVALGNQLVRLIRGVVADLGHDNEAPAVRAVVTRHLRALDTGS
jgi:hypothetical protein